MWPALLAASVSDAASAVASEFAQLAAAAEEAEPPLVAPRWASANEIALELATMRVRDFSGGSAGEPTLICAPFALHGATIADFAPGHSLVAALRAAGRGQTELGQNSEVALGPVDDQGLSKQGSGRELAGSEFRDVAALHCPRPRQTKGMLSPLPSESCWERFLNRLLSRTFSVQPQRR